MKKIGILHPDLACVLATLGHGDTLVVADAGLPIPAGPLRIDLAYAPGRAPFLDVLDAILTEMQLERATLANEIRDRAPGVFYQAVRERLEPLAPLEYLAHEQFKRVTADARAVVRSGEFTPYANVILVSGVVF